MQEDTGKMREGGRKGGRKDAGKMQKDGGVNNAKPTNEGGSRVDTFFAIRMLCILVCSWRGQGIDRAD